MKSYKIVILDNLIKNVLKIFYFGNILFGQDQHDMKHITIVFDSLYWVSQKKPNVWFDVSWKRLYVNDMLLYFLNPHTST